MAGLLSRPMKTASYIFYGLGVLSALAGIAAASFAKEQMGQVSLLIAIACKNLAERQV